MKRTALALFLALAAPALAAVPSASSRSDQVGNGVTTAFAFTFTTYASSHVEVYLSGVKQVGGYAVGLNANQATTPGGTVTFTVPPVNGIAVRIQRVVPLTQETVYTPYSAFPAKTHEKALDRLAMQAQQIDRRVADAETTHAADKATTDARDTAQDTLIADTRNMASVGVADGATVLATGSTTARALRDRAAELVNVKDFGARGDGATDDTAAIQAAIDSVMPAAETVDNALFANPVRVFFPKGTYMVSAPVLTYTGIELTGQGVTSALKATAGFVGTGILKQGAVGSGTYFQHSIISALAFRSAGPSVWAIDFSMIRVSQSVFQDLAIFTAKGLNLSLYTQTCTVRRVRSYGALDQLLWLKGNWNLVEDIDKEGTSGTTTDPYILLQNHALDPYGSSGNIFRKILVEGVGSVNKTPFVIEGTVSNLVLEDLWFEPTLTNGYVLDISSAKQVRVRGVLNYPSSTDRRITVHDNSDVAFEEFWVNEETAGRLSEMLIVDGTSTASVGRLFSRYGMGNNRLASTVRIGSQTASGLLATPATGYSPTSSVRPIIAANLLANPSFESNGSSWSWTGRAADTQTWGASENIPGSQMGTFAVVVGANSVLYQNVTISAAMVGKPYTLSALVKVTGNGTVAPWTEGAGISGGGTYNGVVAKDGWAIVSSTVVPQAAGALQVGVIAAAVDAGSTWYIDEVSFSPGTEAMIIPVRPLADPTYTSTVIASGTSPLVLKGAITDSAADANFLDTVNALTTPGGNLLNVRNAGTSKFRVDKDGNTIALGSLTATGWSVSAASTFAFGASSSKTLDYGTAAPGASQWYAGSVRLNSSPGAGKPIGWVCTASGTPGTWVSLGQQQGVSADRGDTGQTLTVGTDAPVQRWATTLTANRTVTCSTTGAANGDTFRVVRTGLGAFTLDVCGLKTIASGTAAFVDVAYDGASWRLTGYGAL